MIRTTKPEVVQAVRNRIAQERVGFRMAGWGVIATDVRGQRQYASCGTAACIAGHAVLMARLPRCTGDVEGDGIKALGLVGDAAKDLFYTTDWPDWARHIMENDQPLGWVRHERQIAIELLDAILAGEDPWDRNYRPKYNPHNKMEHGNE